MTLDTDTTAPVTDTPAPASAPEAKAPAGPDPYKEELSKAEQLDQAEEAELRAAFKRAQTDNTSEPEDEDKPQPARDPKTGKFAPALKEELKTEDDQPKAEKPEAKAEKATKDADQKPAPKPEEAKTPAVEAPKHWTDKQKAALSKLDPEEQEAFIKEATEARQHLSRQGNALKAYEPIGRVIQENKALFDRAGVTPDQGIAALLRAQAQLSDPSTALNALMKIAQDFNIDLGASAAAEDQEFADPDVLQLRQELEETRRVARESQETLQRMLSEQRAQAAEGMVNQFFRTQNETIDDATAENVALRVKMIRSAYPNANPQDILARAWEEVRALDPGRQEKIIAEKMKAQAALVEEARRAQALAVQSEPDPLSAASEDEMLRRAYRKGRAA